VSLQTLITNNTLAERSGTALYVRDLANGLLARGDTPLVYTPEPGEIARELAHAGVEVVDAPGKLSVMPDVIHGHHEIPTMAALLHFRGVPGIFVCHDRRHHSDTPPRFPRIRRYVAVDHYCRERFVEHGIAEERIRVVPNGVDLRRFRPRGPLPDRPRRALVFSNNASERTHLPVVREACDRAGLALDVIGWASGNPCPKPEAVLARYDVVLAKGRCAVEAAAVGAAVILCDALGAGPLVTSDNLDALRRFDGRTKQLWLKPLRPDVILREIARYDARDATEVSRRIRQWADLRGVVEQLTAIYHEVLAEHGRERESDREEAAAAAAFWRGSRGRRLRHRIKRIPGVGRWLLAMKQKIAPYRPAF
jgi:hypothetical protein